LNTSNGANLRRGEMSSYPPFASASSAVRAVYAVRAVRCFVTPFRFRDIVVHASSWHKRTFENASIKQSKISSYNTVCHNRMRYKHKIMFRR